MAELNSTNTLLAGFVVSVYVLGFAIGPRSRSWLEMGFMGPYNHRRILYYHLSSLPTQDLYNYAPQAQNSTSC